MPGAGALVPLTLKVSLDVRPGPMSAGMSEPNPRHPRVALVGCGAIAARFHLPALLRRLPPTAITLVDPDRGRAERLGRPTGVTRVMEALDPAFPELDAVIIAAPPHLHLPLGLLSLRSGKPVLSEKPLAESGEGVEALAQESERSAAPIAVNNTLRFYPVYQAFHTLARSGDWGELLRVVIEHGERFDWPCAPGSYFGTHGRGRGVLLDQGAHALDLVCWWVGQRPTVRACRTDAMGGTEAYVEVQASLNRIEVEVKLSWLSKLRNRVLLEFEKGTVETVSHEQSTYLTRRGGKVRWRRAKGTPVTDLADRVIGNFLDVVAGTGRPAVSARDVLPGMQLIDECYALAKRRSMPWFDHLAEYAHG